MIVWIHIQKLYLRVAAILVWDIRHFGSEAASIGVVAVIRLREYLITADFAIHVVGQDHWMGHIELLIQKWLHPDIYLTLLLALQFHSFLESARHTWLLYHYDVWILADWLLDGLGIGSLVELSNVLAFWYSWVIGDHTALVDVEVGAAHALLLSTNCTLWDCHYWIIVLLLKANWPTGHMLVHFFPRRLFLV